MHKLLKFTFVAFFVLASISSCKKTTSAPDYPELIGSWSGSTSQSQVISLYVDNIEGTLYLTSLGFTIFFDTGGQQSLKLYSSEGLTSVNNRYFKYLLGTGIYGQSYVDGTFNTSSMTVTGTFKCYNPSNPNDYTSGTFVASKAK